MKNYKVGTSISPQLPHFAGAKDLPQHCGLQWHKLYCSCDLYPRKKHFVDSLLFCEANHYLNPCSMAM